MAKPQIPFSETKHNYDNNKTRAEHIRRDDDTFQTPKVSIYDVDYAILYWLSEHLRIQVLENKRIIDVPVLFANGETWSQIRQHGYMRDSENKIMTPLISIRRNSMVQDDRLLHMDGNRNSNRVIMYPYRNMNSMHDQIGSLFNTKKSNTYYLVAFPDYYRVSYEILIWSTTQEQMNDIVHNIMSTHRYAWGDTLKFTTSIMDTMFETINSPSEDRLVRATMSIEVSAALLKEFEMRESTVQKAYSIKRVRFENEREQSDIILYEEQTNDNRIHISKQPEKELREDGRRNIRYPQKPSKFDL